MLKRMKKRKMEYIAYVWVLVITCFISYVNYQEYKSQIVEKYQKEVLKHVLHQSASIEQNLKQLEGIVLAYRAVFEMVGIDNLGAQDINKNTRTKATIKETVENSQLINSIYFISQETGNGINKDKIFTLEQIGADLRLRPWYIQALENPGIQIAPMYKDHNTKKDTFTFSTRVVSEDKIIGVVALDVFIDDWNLTFQLNNNDDRTKYYLLDKYGTIISHFNPSNIGQHLTNIKEFQARVNIPTDNGISEDYIDLWRNHFSIKETGRVQYIDYKNKKAYSYFQKIPGYDWTIVSIFDEDDIKLESKRYLISSFIISVTMVLLFWIAIWYWIKRNLHQDSLTGVGTKALLYKRLAYLFKKKQDVLLLYVSFIRSRKINIMENLVIEFSNNLVFLSKSDENVFRMGETDFIVLFSEDDIKCKNEKVQVLFKNLSSTVFLINNEKYMLDLLGCQITMNPKDILNLYDYLGQIEKSFHQVLGRGITGMFSEAELHHETDLRLETQEKKEEILLALQEDRIVPFFQPIIDMNSCNPFSYEVLMRIREGERYLSPMPFVQVAEEINLINELDSRVIVRALEYKKKVDKDDLLKLSFNLSAKELADDTFLAKAIEIIDMMGLKRQNICWEITESAKLEDLSLVSALVLKYKKEGFTFAIDDFGTGFSSMNYLQQIPANYVKIDGSIIKKIAASEQSFFLVCSLVNLAKAFNMGVVAEFVENEEIAQKIKEAKINYGQGYYFAKPDMTI